MTQTIWIGSLADTPFAPVWGAVSERGLVATMLQGSEEAMRAEVARLVKGEIVVDPGRVAPILQQVAEFLRRQRRDFDLTIDWAVLRPFQQEALRHVYAIPYGEQCTYGDIAKAMGKPGASRAVGRANATNPMAPIIPCHRVVGSDGKLRGYGGPGGLETKAMLLRMEGSWLI